MRAVTASAARRADRLVYAGFAAVLAALLAWTGAAFYNMSGTDGAPCAVTYSRTFDGLYLTKYETCTGRMGWQLEPKRVARRALFEAF